MSKNKSTKRALLLSALSLLMCVSMLVGSTFAWFTDSVTSGNNIIKAGNLDVELDYKKVVDGVATEWASVKDRTDIFDPNALWEPGHVEVVYLRVANKGSLELKYQLGVNFKDTAIGKTEDGKEIKLSDHLVFATVASDTEKIYANRDEVVKAAAGTEKGLKDYNGTTTALEVGGEDYLTLIVYMPETVGNEANYRGDAIPTIELGINLYATQYTAEEDSFDAFYDEDAWADGMKVYNADDLGAALAKGGKVVLEADIVANEHMDIPEGVTVALNMNGHTLTGTAQNVIYSEGNLTIVGEGKINATKQGYNYAIRAQKGSIVIDGNITVEGTFGCIEIYNGSNVTINKGSYNAVGINGMTSHTVYVAGSTLTVNGGTFDSGYSSEGIDTICGNSTATITLNGGRFYASELGESFFLKGNVVVNGGTYQYNPGSRIADGLKAVKNADGSYTVLKGDVVATDTASLTNALANGGTIALGAGEYTMSTTSKDVTIVGTKDTKVKLPANQVSGNGNVITLEGVTIIGNDNGNFYSALFNGATKVVYKNCDIYNQLSIYTNTEFIDCNFYNTFANDYSVYCYSGNEVKFDGCSFDTKCSKAIKVYHEGTCTHNIYVNDCTFTTETANKKAAVEIDSSYNTYHIYFTGENTINGAYTKLWNSDPGEDKGTFVYVDGVLTVNSTSQLQAMLKSVSANTTIALAANTVFEEVVLTGNITDNLTIVGAEGAVVKGIHGVNLLNVKGLTLKNIALQDKGLYFDRDGGWNRVDDLTMDNCSFVGSGVDNDVIGNRLFDVSSDSPGSNQYYNIVIENCTVSNAIQGMRLGGLHGDNNIIRGTTIANVGHNAITIRTNFGKVLAEGNIISNGGDRALRIGTNEGTVTYKNNFITNCGDEEGSNFKANTLGTVVFDGNTVNGAAWNPLV